MKKVFLTAILGLALLTVVNQGAFAQQDNNIMEVGTTTVNIGIGAGRGGYSYNGYNGFGYGYGSGFGTKVAIERGMWQLGPGVLTLGAEVGGSFSKSGSYKSNIIVVAARSAYHFGWNVPSLDTYGGVSLGPGFRGTDYDFANNDKRTKRDVIITPGVFVGASYYFSPRIGVNVEAGYDITVIQGGLVFKLN